MTVENIADYATIEFIPGNQHPLGSFMSHTNRTGSSSEMSNKTVQSFGQFYPETYEQ